MEFIRKLLAQPFKWVGKGLFLLAFLFLGVAALIYGQGKIDEMSQNLDKMIAALKFK